jgi:pimeloyl-ACP methyl ester carboxylesterase
MLKAIAETSYAKCGDLSLAYQVFGDGPIDLVFVGMMVSHLELSWTQPEFKAFFDQLATFCRVVLFDKAGMGLSDPIAQVRTLDDRANEIEAVMDAVGFERAALFGLSEGGTASIVFAAKRPDACVDPQRYLPVHDHRMGRHRSRPRRAAGTPHIGGR